MLHKGAQKRIYYEGATYFVTNDVYKWQNYFQEPIFCELFIEVLKLARKMKAFDLYAFVIMPDHIHLLMRPNKSEDLPKIIQFIKRNFTRNINFILGYHSEEAIYKSLLQLREKYTKYKNLIENHYKFLFNLKNQFTQKYKLNPFPKFHWQKSYLDHYIRNQKDFDEHIRYIYENPLKHKIPNARNYQYIYTNYQDLITE
jgi:REP element-mobilizing transposase RayT